MSALECLVDEVPRDVSLEVTAFFMVFAEDLGHESIGVEDYPMLNELPVFRDV